MPTYFFKVKHGTSVEDDEGLDLPNIDAAWEEATTACGEMIKELDGSLVPGSEWSIEVQDEFRNTLRTLKTTATSKPS